MCSAAALLTASFIDLKLDILLNNPNDAFSLWFEATGEMPARLVCVFGGAVLFFFAEKKSLRIIGLIIEIGGSTYFGYYISYYLFLNKEKWYKRSWLCFLIPFVYTSIVAFTRLVVGAHYLSDVTIGGTVSFTIVIIAISIYQKNIINNHKSR